MDVGSSNGLERRPTCHFVQVIFGCIRLKRVIGRRGLRSPAFFYFPRKRKCKLFSFFAERAIFTLETPFKLRYNAKVYAAGSADRGLYQESRGNDYMSSSTKKQLRREQVAAKKAEQQQAAAKENNFHFSQIIQYLHLKPGKRYDIMIRSMRTDLPFARYTKD